jgi:ribosome-interacting GTPase 1
LKVKMVVCTKTDLADASTLKTLSGLKLPRKLKRHFISAVTGTGIDELLKSFWDALKR